MTGVTDKYKRVLNCKTSKKEKIFYTVPVDPQPIFDRETPMKYLDDDEKIQRFKDKFGVAAFDAHKATFERNSENNKKMARGRLFGERKNPIIDFLPDVREQIKSISGCDVSMKTHNATKKLFSDLKPNDRIITISLACRHRPKPSEEAENIKGCGVGAITVDIFVNKKADIKYEPAEKTDDVEFTVHHIKRKGVIPRLVE